MNILAIDMGKSSTGWAALVNDGIHTGRLTFAKEKSDGDVYAKLSIAISDLVNEYDIDMLAFEIPTPMNRKSAAVQYGMVAIGELVATKYDLAYLKYMPSEIKKHARGLTQDMDMTIAGVPASKIPTCKLYAVLLKQPPTDHNIADAVALLSLTALEQGIDVTRLDSVRRTT